MDVVHLNQKQLAARWCISEATLERWRSDGIGPKFPQAQSRELLPVDLTEIEELVFVEGVGYRELERQLEQRLQEGPFCQLNHRRFALQTPTLRRSLLPTPAQPASPIANGSRPR